jgi:GT2 family glycosyltransferase
MGLNKAKLRQIAGKALPKGSVRRQVAGKIYGDAKRILTRKSARTLTYPQWVQRAEPAVWVQPRKYKRTPLISVVVPVYNTPDKYFFPLLESLREQLYDKWELCIADGSTDPERSLAIQKACQLDDRVHYKKLSKNHGIVGNTNEAIKLAKGDFVGFLDHDDVLSPHALLEVVDALNLKPDTDFFYSDEDKISDNGKTRLLPHFKPDWSPSLLESVNYITHFAVIRTKVLKKVGAIREGFDGAQDYDLILRVTDYTDKIVHIPKILYHWRQADGSTAGEIGNKAYADDAGQRALRDHVARKKIDAEVCAVPNAPTNYRLKYKVPKGAKASIIIPFKDKVDLLKVCVPSILDRTTYKNYEIILLSNNSVEQETHDYLETLKDHPKVRVFYWDHPYNFSALNNFGRKQATGDFLVLLNNDTEVISSDWLTELLGVAAQPWAGAIGPMLLYPKDKIQHAGIILGMGGMAGHVFRFHYEDSLSIFGRPSWPRDYLAVTAACLAIRTSKYDEVHGLDEKLVMCGNDVALGIRLYEKGYRNVYWPYVKLYHYENASVGSYKNAPAGDYDRSLIYYRPYLNWHDPYFNPNLSLTNEQVALREHYE